MNIPPVEVLRLREIVCKGEVLCDPRRVRMLASLGRPRTVGQLALLADITSSTCSYHLRRLEEVGMVQVERVGRSHIVRRVASEWAAVRSGWAKATSCR